MKISLCITNYNRLAYLFKSFEQVLNDERIDEVVIVDDCSDINLYRSIEEITRYMPKVKLFRNENNLDVYANKREAISKAENEYCIIFDSDNVISTKYLDKIYSVEWNSKTILAPDFAEPVFDYTKYAGIVFTKQNIAQYAMGCRSTRTRCSLGRSYHDFIFCHIRFVSDCHQWCKNIQ